MSVNHSKLARFEMLIGGERVPSLSGRTFETVNPYTGKPWAIVPRGSGQDVDRAVAAARAALEGPWGRLTGTQRSGLMRRLAELIATNAERLARIETTDNGKVLREMSGQLQSLPEWYNYFSGVADKLEGATIPGYKSNFFIYTLREPIGVVALIVPWNSPLLTLSYKLAPALAAGCCVVAKPAEQTPVSTLAFAELFEMAGFPPGVFNVVTGYGEEAGHALAAHRYVDKIAFTGSTATGVQVMKDAADWVHPVSLELGGKSPNIVFADSDIGAATNGVIAGIFAAAGQTCVAGARLLVERSVHDELVGAVVDRARALKMGDPFSIETEIGPIAFKEQLEKIEEYVEIGRQEGATLVLGGGRPQAPEFADGFFIEPTVFTGVSNQMRIAQEEIFGPVLSVIPFGDEDEAVGLANDSQYGLAAGVWTRDIQRGHRMAQRLQAGTVWVNTYRNIAFNVPFGGYKFSGIGRENGLEGLAEYTKTKAVWVELSGETRDPFKLG